MKHHYTYIEPSKTCKILSITPLKPYRQLDFRAQEIEFKRDGQKLTGVIEKIHFDKKNQRVVGFDVYLY